MRLPAMKPVWVLGAKRTFVAVAAFAGLCVAGAARADEKVGYNAQVRSILSDNCFYCHGPDKNHRNGKFRLDDRDAALEGGKSGEPAIVPGKPEGSELVKRITSTDADDLMPPPDSHKTLTAEQKEILKRWIAQGAVYEPHWAYIAPKRAATPAVKDAGWVRNPIDAFVLAALENKGIAPSKEADRRTLLRRLSLDLIGLPPTPAEVAAFLADSSPDAYEKQVDRLLASPHFGERMAVPWLDYVRFADTVGFHGDQNQNVFPYRDYVINAFNADKPFDQFTVEQLAGDLLPNPTEEQRVATCFNRLTMMTREGGAQAKEYLAKYTADRVRTVSNAWLGSTMGCCECHNHKFDPFTAKDFYSLGAFWSDVKQWGIYTTYKYTPNPELKGFTNDYPFPPEIVVESPYLKARIERLTKQLDEVAAKAVAGDKDGFAAWQQATAKYLKEIPSGWTTLSPGATTKPAAKDGAVVFTGKAGGTDKVEVALPAGVSVAAVRIEALPRGGSILRKSSAKVDEEDETAGKSATVQPTLSVKHGGKDVKLNVFFADADQKEPKYRSGHALIGVTEMWKTSAKHEAKPQTAVYVLDAPVKAGAGDVLTVTLPKNQLAAVRVSVSSIASVKPLEAAAPSERTYLLSTGFDKTALAEARKIEREIYECRDGKSPVMTTVAVAPTTQRVLPRGNWQDESGEVVQPSVPGFLPQPSEAGKRRLTRLDLAKWLVSKENPLTSRAFVNRLWKQFFGNGISNQVEDLGAQGEWPSHPELLDWLAVEFRDGAVDGSAKAWDVKHVVRLIVTSAAYRQSSSLRPELKDVDPQNRLLASQNPRRLEAEFVRDNALAAAGLIDLDLGGPSAFPYQPEGYYANIQFPDRRYVASTDDRQYRRGVYTHWQRTFLHPMLANFDAPSREDGVCTRNVSNTPQQALTLLNDPSFVEAARVLAEHVTAETSGDEARVNAIYLRVLAREPKGKEKASLAKFLAEQREYYNGHRDDAKKLISVGNAPVPAGVEESELAAWTTVCRVVLNLHESVTRY